MKENKPVDFTIPTIDGVTAAQSRFDLSMQGQMGDFFVNGVNDWHFGVLLYDGPESLSYGVLAGFVYSNDWTDLLKPGVNTIRYVPKRQPGVADDNVSLSIKIGYGGDQDYLDKVFGAAELIDGEPIEYTFMVEDL
ncbi:hypothetical protein MNBD_GAMMA09-2620 [hydrothermal vent metagenome]|uniref:Uncharacterized protein n=1 Tax=hydrothermal vent metagenome TaxID=652676 RepID=A0A3B0XW43_9ZZZZ